MYSKDIIHATPCPSSTPKVMCVFQVNRSVSTDLDNDGYVYVGYVARLTTCFTVPDTCPGGATLTAWVRLVRCIDSQHFHGIPDSAVLSTVTLTDDIDDTTGIMIPCGATDLRSVQWSHLFRLLRQQYELFVTIALNRLLLL